MFGEMSSWCAEPTVRFRKANAGMSPPLLVAPKLLLPSPEMQPNHAMPERRSVSLIVASLFVAILAAYSGVVHCDFIYLDDTSHVFENQTVLDGLTLAGIKEVFSEPHASLWVPLTRVSFMADVSLFGLNPRLMHIENVLWHSGAAALLFLALRRLTGRLWPSAMVAALFGLHTVNVESVAWISERKNVLCAFFVMAALLAWSHWALERSVRAWWLALLAFAAALLAKPMAVTFPCVLLLLDAWPLRRAGWRLLWEKVPFFVLSVAASIIATGATRSRNSVLSLDHLPLAARVSNALCSYGAYLRDLVWPSGLAVFYPHPGVAHWAPALALLAGGLLLTGVAVWQWRRHPYLLIGWFIFLGMLVPNLGLVQVGSQARADRFVYFAQIGFFIAVVWLSDAFLPASRWLRIAAAIAPLLALLVATSAQVPKWENSRELFQHAASVTTNNAMALEHLAYALRRAGETDLAIQKLEASLAIFPENAIGWKELGSTHLRIGENKLAARDFRNAVALDPGDTFARCNFAISLAALGDTANAEALFLQALSADPAMVQAHFRYGLMLEKLGRTAEAKAQLQEALRLDPQNTRVAEACQRLKSELP